MKYPIIGQKATSLLAGIGGIVLLLIHYVMRPNLPAIKIRDYGILPFGNHMIFLVPGSILLAIGLAFWLPLNPVRKTIRSIHQLSPLTFIITACLTCLVITVSVNLVALDGIPHVQDSIVQYFQARIFASGNLWIDAPSSDLAPFFDSEFVIQRAGRMYGKYNPGLSLLLVPFIWMGIPWLLVPLTGTLALAVLYLLIREEASEGIARGCVLLALGSPFFLGLSSSFMNHTPALLASLIMLLSWSRLRKKAQGWWGVILGAATGFLVITRQLTAVYQFAPILLFLMRDLVRSRALLRQIIHTFILIGLAITILGIYFWIVNGDPFISGYAMSDPHDRIGFGKDIGLQTFGSGHYPGHTIASGLRIIKLNLLILNELMFGWPSVSLAFVFIAMFRPGKSSLEHLLILQFLTQLFGYSLYWCDGICFGSRYMYETIPAILLLTARGIQQFPNIRWVTESKYARLPVLPVLLFILFTRSLVFFTPELLKTYSSGYWNVDRKLEDIIQRENVNNAVVFVSSSNYKLVDGIGPDYYGTAFLLNDLSLNGSVIVVRDLGRTKNQEFMAKYPDREAFLFYYPMRKDNPADESGPELVKEIF